MIDEIDIEALKYALLDVIILGAIIIPLIVLASIATDKLAEYNCEARGKVINMEVQYNTSTGCMVKTEHGWINYDKMLYIKNLNKE